MTLPIWTTLLASVAIATMGSASAQPVSSSEVELTSESRQLAFLNTGARGERLYHDGDVILDIPLVWEAGATLLDPVRVVADDMTLELKPGRILQAVILTENASGKKLQAFCTQREAAERKADKGALGVLLGGGSLWRKMIRDATDGQYCLIDRDEDGVAEQSVQINAGTPAARTPIAIPPARLDRQNRVPISPDDKLRLTLTHVSVKGTSFSIRLDIIQQGEPRGFTSFRDQNRLSTISLKNGFPAVMNILGANFEVLRAGGNDRAITILWPENVDPRYALPIPDGLRVMTSYYPY
jgi:hypothetical protein